MKSVHVPLSSSVHACRTLKAAPSTRSPLPLSHKVAQVVVSAAHACTGSTPRLLGRLKPSTNPSALAVQTNLDTPGLRVLSISPPVMVIDNFLDAETCSAFVNAARACDALQPSQIGVNKLGDASNAASHRRTSTSLLLDKTAQQQYPTLRVRTRACTACTTNHPHCTEKVHACVDTRSGWYQTASSQGSEKAL